MTLTRRALLGLFVAAASRALLAQPPGKARIVRIQAKKFEYTPREITLKAGQAVELELTALDFVHGFNVPDLKLRADLSPGQVTRLSFTPAAPGTIDFLCDNFCGTGHEEMNGRFIVEA
ncbi:MAG: cupredoxin domain-containing protein [Massilia sp.]